MEALLKPAAFIVLGEMHGTQEAPAFTTRLVCHAAAAGQPVRVGLELPVADPDLVFMSNHLLAAEPGLVTLDMANLAGSMWVCMGMTAEACKVHPLKTRHEEHAATPRIVLQQDAPERKYDGVYGVGPVSASPPAVHAATALPTP